MSLHVVFLVRAPVVFGPLSVFLVRAPVVFGSLSVVLGLLSVFLVRAPVVFGPLSVFLVRAAVVAGEEKQEALLVKHFDRRQVGLIARNEVSWKICDPSSYGLMSRKIFFFMKKKKKIKIKIKKKNKK